SPARRARTTAGLGLAGLELVPDLGQLLDVRRRVEHGHLLDRAPVLHPDGADEGALPLLLEDLDRAFAVDGILGLDRQRGLALRRAEVVDPLDRRVPM